MEQWQKRRRDQIGRMANSHSSPRCADHFGRLSRQSRMARLTHSERRTVNTWSVDQLRAEMITRFEQMDRRLDESFAVFKNTPISERVSHQFRVEIQNPLNRVVFGDPVTNFASGNFGQITSTQIKPRSFQFGMKLLW